MVSSVVPTEEQVERLIEVLMRIHLDLHRDLLQLSSDLHEVALSGQTIRF